MAVITMDMMIVMGMVIDNVYFYHFPLVSYVQERPWWPIQSPNKGRKWKANRRGSLLILNFKRGQVVGFGQDYSGDEEDGDNDDTNDYNYYYGVDDMMYCYLTD